MVGRYCLAPICTSMPASSSSFSTSFCMCPVFHRVSCLFACFVCYWTCVVCCACVRAHIFRRVCSCVLVCARVCVRVCDSCLLRVSCWVASTIKTSEFEDKAKHTNRPVGRPRRIEVFCVCMVSAQHRPRSQHKAQQQTEANGGFRRKNKERRHTRTYCGVRLCGFFPFRCHGCGDHG